MWYDVVVTVLAVGMVVCWRLGVRDGMRLGDGKAPEQAAVPRPEKKDAAPVLAQDAGQDEELQKQLRKIDEYDGWKV